MNKKTYQTKVPLRERERSKREYDDWYLANKQRNRQYHRSIKHGSRKGVKVLKDSLSLRGGF